MRFDTEIQLITLSKIDDGLGGHTESERILANVCANFEELSIETTVRIYGDAFNQNARCIVLGKYPQIHKIKTQYAIYKVVKQLPIRNKTSFFLEVDND